jgi:hypothetical protein
MGYSHYWSHDAEIPAATWAQITGDATRLVTAFRPGLSRLTIGPDRIIFNGAPPKDFETFGLRRRPQDVVCKTDHRPYDTLVCAVLSVAKQHYPALNVSSDALFEGLAIWPDAAKWASKILGRDVPIPWKARPTIKGWLIERRRRITSALHR